MADPYNPLKGLMGGIPPTEGARSYPGGSNFKTYGLIIDEGYGTRSQGMAPSSYITAETPQQARKAFLKRHEGAWYTKNPGNIRATKVYDYPIEQADQHAPDWLPGGKYHK